MSTNPPDRHFGAPRSVAHGASAETDVSCINWSRANHLALRCRIVLYGIKAAPAEPAPGLRAGARGARPRPGRLGSCPADRPIPRACEHRADNSGPTWASRRDWTASIISGGTETVRRPAPDFGGQERGKAITAGLKREVRKETGLDIEPGPIHRRVFRSQPIGGQLTPSDETSDVRWACANKLADITTEVFATRLLDGVAYTGPPALRFHDREHLL